LEATPIFSDLNISDRIRNILLQQGWTYSFCFVLLQCAWMKRLKHPNGSTISMSAILADSIPIWSETPMFSKLSATHVVGVAHSTTEALANMDSHSPKHVERWS
jgi:hypothetical protein